MKSNAVNFYIPPKTKLLLLTSLALTIFFALPKLGLILKHGPAGTVIDPNIPDLVLRMFYTFPVAFLFLWFNLEKDRISIGTLNLDLTKWRYRIPLNLLLLFFVNVFLIRLHLWFVDSLVQGQFFKPLFTIGNVLLVVFCILAAHIYQLVFRNQQVEFENKELQKKNAEARYEALKNQLNPHFLFNAFNTLNSLIEHDRESAVSFVNDMSDVYRYVLRSSYQDLVFVEEELEFLAAYNKMLLHRHAPKLVIDVDINDDFRNYKILPMALQMLVENAIKNNKLSTTSPLNIRIFPNGDSAITVMNNLQQRFLKKSATGIGLYNLNERYLHLTGREILIRETENKFIVTVPVISNDENPDY